ncbi:hypothetical protein [Actinoalloteichus caeruleus]|uniref:Uncharacterized protein n=1 Tax=Actinoalloteichus caeruleus DSM 43889 TaxID=1120930 RepID=A0ABT1JP58_ACTCY|nr:hypothetical protein [Actinoalloteichus caeruleus]MCP2334313.1 hypothetical protein [Actinoalloteichus caeruleus DSM 43889]
MAGRWITKNGRKIFIEDSRGSRKAGPVVAAAATVTLMGAASVGTTGGTLFGGGQVVTGAGNQAVARVIQTRLPNARKAARNGQRTTAWKELRVTQRHKKRSRRHTNCARHSFGQVRTFFQTTPCQSLRRQLFSVRDEHGNDVAVSIAWVRMRDAAEVWDLRQVFDEHGSGDFHPAWSPFPELSAVRFTAEYYGSEPHGRVLTIAEAEPLSGSPDPALLHAVADIAAHLPSP